MPAYFFDTSALSKHYHPESGTRAVDEIIGGDVNLIQISRLTVIELASVFAIKVRTRFITEEDAVLLLRQFREDLVSRAFTVVSIGEMEYELAERLIRKYAFSLRLRALDALQLAVAS